MRPVANRRTIISKIRLNVNKVTQIGNNKTLGDMVVVRVRVRSGGGGKWHWTRQVRLTNMGGIQN